MKNVNFSATLCLFTLLAATALSGCATQSPRTDRRISAAGEGALIEFMQALSHDSSAGRTDFEKAFFEAVNKDSDGLSVSKIHSLEDLRALSADDQAQLVKRLAADPAIKDTLGLSSDDTVNAARAEALAAQDSRSVVTSGVADIHSSIGPAAMAAEDAEIRRLTGVSILGEHSSSITDPEASRNLQTIVDNTHSDVVSGKVRKPAEIEKDLDQNISKTEDTNEGVARNRRCRLAQPSTDGGGCGVFSKAMYEGCDE